MSRIKLMLSKIEFSSWRILLYGVPFILVLIISIVFEFNGLYGQDSHAYYQFSKELWLYIENGKQFGDFYWPKTYSFIGAVLSYSGLTILFSLRLVSFLSLIGALFYSNKIIKILYKKDGSLFLLLGASLSTYFVRASLFVMSDMLAVFLIVLFFYHYVMYWKSKQIKTIIMLAIFSMMSFLVRYACLPLVVFPLLTVLLDVFNLLKKGKMLLILSLFVLFGIFIFNNQEFIQFLFNEFSVRWNFKNIITRTFVNTDGVLKHWVPNFIYVFGNFMHLGYLSFGVLLLPFYKKQEKINRLILISVFIYFLFIAGVYSQNYRFLIITHLPVLILLFPLFDSFFSWLKSKNLHLIFILGVVFFNTSFFIYSFGKTYRVHRNEKVIAKELKKIGTNKAIYSFYVDQSFPSYDVNNEIRNLYLEKIIEFEKGSIVVFNEEQLKTQWKNTQVMDNWNRLNQNNELKELVCFENNWKIYLIE